LASNWKRAPARTHARDRPHREAHGQLIRSEAEKNRSLLQNPSEDDVLSRVFASLFAFLDVAVFSRLVRDGAAARAHSTADQRTLPAAHQAAHDCSTDRRSANNLRAGVMVMIARPLCRDCPPVAALSSGFLARRSERQGQN
jgi:hypothetical protein